MQSSEDLWAACRLTTAGGVCICAPAQVMSMAATITYSSTVRPLPCPAAVGGTAYHQPSKLSEDDWGSISPGMQNADSPSLRCANEPCIPRENVAVCAVQLGP